MFSFATSTDATITTFANIAQIVIAIFSAFIFWQILIAKKDTRLRSKREAGLLTFQLLLKYSDQILPQLGQIESKLKSESLAEWKPQNLTHFSKQELDKMIDREFVSDLLPSLNYLNNTGAFAKLAQVINSMEAIANCFLNGIADESIAFSSIGSTFCDIVERYYFVLCVSRDKTQGVFKYYNNIVALYKMWHDRLQNKEGWNQIEILQHEIETKKTKLPPDINVPPIGA